MLMQPGEKRTGGGEVRREEKRMEAERGMKNREGHGTNTLTAAEISQASIEQSELLIYV